MMPFCKYSCFCFICILILFRPAPHLKFCYAILIGLFDSIWYFYVTVGSHSLTQSHMKDNDMRNLAGFLFSMIIHFHHCYIKISYTVKQAYKDKGNNKITVICFGNDCIVKHHFLA
jgi:hypothetical protein